MRIVSARAEVAGHLATLMYNTPASPSSIRNHVEVGAQLSARLPHLLLATAGRARLVAPPIIGFQPGGEWALGAPLTLHAKGTGSSVGFNRIPNAPCEGLLLRIDK